MVKSDFFDDGVVMNGHSTAQRVATDTSEVERIYAGLAGVYDGLFDWALPGMRSTRALCGSKNARNR